MNMPIRFAVLALPAWLDTFFAFAFGFVLFFFLDGMEGSLSPEANN